MQQRIDDILYVGYGIWGVAEANFYIQKKKITK